MSATVSGTVFRDVDSDGIRLSIENGPVSGIEIFLENPTGTSVYNTVSDSEGNFSFNDVTLADPQNGGYPFTLRVNELSLPFDSVVTNGNPVDLMLKDGDLVEHNFSVGYQFRNNSHILVAFGDSLTWGEGDSGDDFTCTGEKGGYPIRLQDRLSTAIPDISVRNEGVCGARGTISGDFFVERVQHHNPGYVLIMYGTNDVLFSEPDETVDALFSMVQYARRRGISPILGLPPITPISFARTRRIRRLDVLIAERANQEQVPLADVFSRFGTDTALFAGDGLHPNPEGYDLLQDVWFDAFVNQPLSHNFAGRSGIGDFLKDLLFRRPDPLDFP